MKPIHITLGMVVAGIAGYLIGKNFFKPTASDSPKFTGFTKDTSSNSMNASGEKITKIKPPTQSYVACVQWGKQGKCTKWKGYFD